jgi:hypothetical protein
VSQQVPYTPTPAHDPGRVLGLVGLILAFIAPVIGLILSLLGQSQAKAAGIPNPLARAGVIASIIMMVVYLGVAAAIVIGSFSLYSGIAQECQQLGPGVHEVNGVTYTCS